MDAKKLVVGMVVGTIVLWLVGRLIWVMAFAGFFAANVGGATGVFREDPMMWPVILGHIAIAALVTFAIVWSGSYTLGGGFKIGAIVGFLLWFGVDFIHYGNLDVRTLTATIADPFFELIRTGIGGAVIGVVLGRLATEDPASSA
jgi:hypothetical protein